IELGDGDGAREHAERAGALAERDGGPWVRGFAACVRARWAAEAGRDREAVEHARAARRRFREAGDRFWERRAAGAGMSEDRGFRSKGGREPGGGWPTGRATRS